MEKVRPWCGQPSDRGRLKNTTEQVYKCVDACTDDDVIEQTERFPRGSVVRVDVSAGYGSLFVAGGQVVVDARAVRQAVDGAQSARMLSLLRTGRGLDVKLRRVVLRVVVVVEVEAVRDVVVEQRLRRSTQSPYSSNSNSDSGGFRGLRGCGRTPLGVLQKNSGSTNFENSEDSRQHDYYYYQFLPCS